MTRQEFNQLAESGVILLDGATGSNLRRAGMPVGVCAEQWVIDHPQVLQDLQRAYVEAGSQIVYAPTFSANRISLRHFGLEDQAAAMNARLAAISKAAVGSRALVAGDLTTVGRPMEPMGDLSYQELFDAYCEQIRALVGAGVDLLVAETLLNADEAVVALDAAQSVCNLPIMCSLTVEADGTAPFGGTAAEAVATLQEMGAAAVGINCSVGPDQLEAVVRSMEEAARIPIIAKPNAGMPVINSRGEAVYDMSCQAFSRHMRRLVELGAHIVGGCCGTTPEYIRHLAAALR